MIFNVYNKDDLLILVKFIFQQQEEMASSWLFFMLRFGEDLNMVAFIFCTLENICILK